MRPQILNSLAVLLTMLAASLYGASLYYLGDEESQFNDWWVKDAVIARSELTPQPGILAPLGLKPIYRGRVVLNYVYGGLPVTAVSDFTHHSLYQAETDRLKSRIAAGSTIRIRLQPYSQRKVHIPGTHAGASAQMMNLAGLLLVLPAGFCYLLAKASVSFLAREEGGRTDSEAL